MFLFSLCGEGEEEGTSFFDLWSRKGESLEWIQSRTSWKTLIGREGGGGVSIIFSSSSFFEKTGHNSFFRCLLSPIFLCGKN